MAQPVLEFRHVAKYFGSVNAVDQVSFSVESSEIFTLLGPSGCGKTTTLRLVAGLEEPDDGEILINNRLVAAPQRGLFVPPEKRQLGMVFQSYAIWPHLTVFENVAFPLRVRHESAEVLRARVQKALDSVGLASLAERGATQLSGGQQQRVALARALVYEPAVLLLDEPLSNLDAKLREQMRFELRALQTRLKLTVLYVTHDQTEAMTLSDRIAVVNRGRFEQIGTPEEVYEKPASSFVGEFLGRTIALEGILRVSGGKRFVELKEGGGSIVISPNASPALDDGKPVRLMTRPEDIEILPIAEPASNQIAARIERVDYLGDRFEYHVRVAGAPMVLSAAKRDRFSVGSQVRLGFDSSRLTVHPK